MTPEAKVKARIKALLKHHGAWFYMPQQFGMGATHLDFICSKKRVIQHRETQVFWETFFIEAKAPGESPTPRQWAIIERERVAGFRVFIIDDSGVVGVKPKHDSLTELQKYLQSY